MGRRNKVTKEIYLYTSFYFIAGTVSWDLFDSLISFSSLGVSTRRVLRPRGQTHRNMICRHSKEEAPIIPPTCKVEKCFYISCSFIDSNTLPPLPPNHPPFRMKLHYRLRRKNFLRKHLFFSLSPS